MTAQPPSKRRRTKAAVAIAAAVGVGLALMLTNTSLGAYILLDYLADDDSGLIADPAAGPLELSEFVTAVEAVPAMPPEIDQPSGMTYLEADRAFAIVTDQAELFVVSDDFTTVRSNTAVLDGLLVTRQGRMEAVVGIDGPRVAVTGEIGDRIDVWRKGAEPGFSLEASIDLSDYAGGGELEIEGLAHNAQTGEFYLSSDETLAIAVVDATGRLLRELTFEDDLQGRLKPGRTLSNTGCRGWTTRTDCSTRSASLSTRCSSSTPSTVCCACWASRTADRSRLSRCGTAPRICRSITTGSTRVRRCWR